MNPLFENLQDAFQDENSRYAYAEAYLNASIAAQIKNQRGDMSQQELADKIGTKQPGISRLENANYSAWKVETLRKLARAFGLRLRITFEEFGTLIPEIQGFHQNILRRRKFEEDPVFNPREDEAALREAFAAGIDVNLAESVGSTLPGAYQTLQSASREPQTQVIDIEAWQLHRTIEHGSMGSQGVNQTDTSPTKKTPTVQGLGSYEGPGHSSTERVGGLKAYGS